ncbi:MAG: hypothetical protein ACJ780_01870 [Solirubrobacteraceae bacterium]
MSDLLHALEKALAAVEDQECRRATRRALDLLAELRRRRGHHAQRGRRPGHEYPGVFDAVEVDVRRAARKTIRDRSGGLECETRLAHASRAHQRDQSHAGAHQQLTDLGELAVTADGLVRGRRQPRGTTGRRGRQLGIVGEDHALQSP